MEDGPPMFNQDITCPDLLVFTDEKDFRYGTITHSGHASQRVLLSLTPLKGWSPFARRY